MRTISLSLALLAATAAPGLSQDSTERLRSALSGMPELLLTNPDPMQIFFLDVSAWRGLGDTENTAAALGRLPIASFIGALEPFRTHGYEGWDEKAGVALDDIRYFAGFGSHPNTISYWGFEDHTGPEGLIAALAARDFVPTPGAADGVLGNGEPNAMNPAARDASDPWRGTFGKTHFVMPLGSTVIQAPAPQTFEMLAATEPSAAHQEVVQSALDGLSRTFGVDEGQIVQAVVISPMFGLDGGDPAALLGAPDLDAARAAVEAAMEESLKGIPPYLGGIIADTQFGKQPAVTVSLTYPDCAIAEVAIDALKLRWTDNMATKAEISGQSVAGSSDLCAAVVNFVGDAVEDQANPLLNETFNQYYSRQFNLLQIGLAGND